MGIQGYKLTGEIMTFIISLQYLDPLSYQVLHKSFELLEPLEDLTLGLQEIDLGLPRVVINECEILLTTTQGCSRHRLTHICVY
jgi:hypothetical protein